MNIKVYNQSGAEVGTVELPKIFELPWNADLVHQVITSYAANKRGGTAHAKGRGEVRGGGRKPWRQKGTGRARHGSIRSPIWKGGGVSHGPKKERNFSRKINKKMARKALFTVLSAKAKDGEILAVDNLSFVNAKTKEGAVFFKKLSAQKGLEKITRGNGVLVAFLQKNPPVERAIRNLPFVEVDESRNLNAYKAMQHKYILFPKDALEMFTKQVKG